MKEIRETSPRPLYAIIIFFIFIISCFTIYKEEMTPITQFVVRIPSRVDFEVKYLQQSIKQAIDETDGFISRGEPQASNTATITKTSTTSTETTTMTTTTTSTSSESTSTTITSSINEKPTTEITAKHTNRDTKNVEDAFKQRKRIYEHGCKFLVEIEALMDSEPELQTLLDFHRQIYNLETPKRETPYKCRYAHRDTTSVRTVNRYGIAMCLPPKCGTTNWQKALIALQQGTTIDNISAKGLDVYRTLQQYKPGTKHDAETVAQQLGLKKINDMKYKVANTRNPFTRLYSAWNDKSRTAFKSDGKTYLEGLTPKRKRQLRRSDRDFHAKYYPGQKLFEHGPPPDGRNVSWETFVKYVSANDGDAAMNWHWRLQHHQCQACRIKYDFITHLDQSQVEAPFLLHKMKVESLTAVPGKYSWSPVEKDELHWQTIPRNLAVKVYQHYFVDFVLYGYSPADAMRFINASDQKRPDDHELFDQSRRKLQNLARYFKQSNDDYIC